MDDVSYGAKEPDHSADVNVARHESLCSALEGLPGDRRALLSLYYEDGFSVGEIAEILRIPEGTVKSRLHSTREMLRQAVEQGSNG